MKPYVVIFTDTFGANVYLASSKKLAISIGKGLLKRHWSGLGHDPKELDKKLWKDMKEFMLDRIDDNDDSFGLDIYQALVNSPRTISVGVAQLKTDGYLD